MVSKNANMSRLWDLVSSRQRIEPGELQEAIEEQLTSDELDYRTRLLIQESAQVLREGFGIEVESGEPVLNVERAGFPSLKRVVGELTKPETIERFLCELASHLFEGVEITIGGSSSLILQGLLLRQTEDVYVVDEVPQALRSLRLTSATKLCIAHFQSHYLPEGWLSRRQSLGDFRKLRVYLVAGLDIYLGKLFSARHKDRADLHYLSKHFSLEVVREHLLLHCRKLWSDPKLRQAAADNWYVLYGEESPLENDR